MRHRNSPLFPCCLSLLLASPLAFATEEEPGFHWNLGAELHYEDNVYRTLDRFAESDTIFVIKPELSWIALRGKHRFDLSYAGDYAFYNDVDDLNYNDHDLRARARLEHSYRLGSEITLGYLKSHDVPGSTDSASLPFGEADKWWDGYGKLQVSYGRTDSKGQLIGQLAYHERRYTNNQQDYRDYNLLRAVGTFFYRVAPKTRALFEVDLDDYDYRNEDSFGLNQTKFEYRLLTGVTWEATAKTSGVFKIGYRNTDYDDRRLNDLSGLALELDGTWKPNSYTRLTLIASQDTQNSAQQGSGGYVRRYLRADLDHAITARTLLSAKVLYGNDTFEGPLDRDDDRWYARLGVTHSLRRWLDVTAEYRYEERDSNIDIYDYDTNIFLIGATTRFD